MDAYINAKDSEYTHPLGWEKKVITMNELLAMNLESDDMASILEGYRDWMLGGKENEWKYEKNKINGEITLWRH